VKKCKKNHDCIFEHLVTLEIMSWWDSAASEVKTEVTQLVTQKQLSPECNTAVIFK